MTPRARTTLVVGVGAVAVVAGLAAASAGRWAFWIDDLTVIQGRWKVVSVGIGCSGANSVDEFPITHLVFEHDTVTAEGRGSDNRPRRQFTFRLDAKYSPTRFDIFDRGEAELQGLYRIKGDSLTLCLSDPSRNSRPTGFTTGLETWLLDLERE